MHNNYTVDGASHLHQQRRSDIARHVEPAEQDVHTICLGQIAILALSAPMPSATRRASPIRPADMLQIVGPTKAGEHLRKQPGNRNRPCFRLTHVDTVERGQQRTCENFRKAVLASA